MKDMRLDDLVATRAGAGYLRGYRHEDKFCILLLPWGHGFIHIKDLEKVQQALEKYLKKRTYNEYVAPEHQQLFEQVEGLLVNLPSPSLKNTTELCKDLDFLRRVQSLANKVEELHRSNSPHEPEHKISRKDTGEDLDMSNGIDHDMPIEMQETTETLRQEEQETELEKETEAT
ncbi:hypothetical protein PsorP6_016380 [Peronosclerospora sorghi]|uniref:Uncharacterized protein n=1 Tax=Peronosclerospora sorghi TaxID=230839 RepID=A0ACC0VPD7_9STRA|nr:hypothetical protein PsorP6_016380 [Peronosclerospora sorghi]